jgi:DNA (cytosine-5)-methyltransferase 1
MWKMIDLCAGVGGIRRGFELAGPFKNVLSCENDGYAAKTYEHLFGENPFADLTTDEFKQTAAETDYDILLAGFPCQAFSAVGYKLGFEDKTRGTIFFHIAEMLKASHPTAFLLENVEGLLTHKRGNTIKVILETLITELGYSIVGTRVDDEGNISFERSSLLRNARNFGLPQNRPRVYLLGIKTEFLEIRGINLDEFELPKKRTREAIYEDLHHLLDYGNEPRYYLSQGYVDTLETHRKRQEARGNGFGYVIVNDDDIKAPVSNTILATGGSGKERNLVIDHQEHIPGTIVGTKQTPLNDECIRAMTPDEWAKLQGFKGYGFMKYGDLVKLGFSHKQRPVYGFKIPKPRSNLGFQTSHQRGSTDKFNFPKKMSNAQRYKQMGNSVAIPLIEEVALLLSSIIGTK